MGGSGQVRPDPTGPDPEAMRTRARAGGAELSGHGRHLSLHHGRCLCAFVLALSPPQSHVKRSQLRVSCSLISQLWVGCWSNRQRHQHLCLQRQESQDASVGTRGGNTISTTCSSHTVASLLRLPVLRIIYIGCNVKLAPPLGPGTRHITRERRHREPSCTSLLYTSANRRTRARDEAIFIAPQVPLLTCSPPCLFYTSQSSTLRTFSKHPVTSLAAVPLSS
jgi:hypothetical protein